MFKSMDRERSAQEGSNDPERKSPVLLYPFLPRLFKLTSNI